MKRQEAVALHNKLDLGEDEAAALTAKQADVPPSIHFNILSS